MCAEHQVFWEGTVHGRVVGRGTHRPVADVNVTWHIPHTSLNGTVMTDGDGFFELYVRDPGNEIWRLLHVDGKISTYDTIDVVADIAKDSDPFGCDGMEHKLCGEKTDAPPIRARLGGWEGGWEGAMRCGAVLRAHGCHLAVLSHNHLHCLAHHGAANALCACRGGRHGCETSVPCHTWRGRARGHGAGPFQVQGNIFQVCPQRARGRAGAPRAGASAFVAAAFCWWVEAAVVDKRATPLLLGSVAVRGSTRASRGGNNPGLTTKNVCCLPASLRATRGPTDRAPRRPRVFPAAKPCL